MGPTLPFRFVLPPVCRTRVSLRWHVFGRHLHRPANPAHLSEEMILYCLRNGVLLGSSRHRSRTTDECRNDNMERDRRKLNIELRGGFSIAAVTLRHQATASKKAVANAIRFPVSTFGCEVLPANPFARVRRITDWANQQKDEQSGAANRSPPGAKRIVNVTAVQKPSYVVMSPP